MEIIKLKTVSNYTDFLNLKGYDDLDINRPEGVENDVEGTYIIKTENSYKIYHCKNIAGQFKWFKLPSIRVSYVPSNFQTESLSIVALNDCYSELPEDLRNIVDLYYKSNK